MNVSAPAAEPYPPPSVLYRAPESDAPRVAEAEGRAPEARLENVAVLWRQEDVVERPAFHFPGCDAAILVDDAPSLNPAEQLTLAVWFKADFRRLSPRKPLLFKPCPARGAPDPGPLSREPWHDCQYGLLIADCRQEMTAYFGLALDGRQVWLASGPPLPLYDGWNHLAGAFDGRMMVLYLNGREFGKNALPAPAAPERRPTPLIVGAYGSPPQAAEHSFPGQIGEFALWDKALSAPEMSALFARQRAGYPPPAEAVPEDSDYSRAVNAALAASEDAWGKEVLAAGDPSYDRVKDYLRPLFYSSGKVPREYAPYNVVLALEDGVRPLIAAAGDGGSVHVDKYGSDDALVFHVGSDGGERFGSALDRLGGQRWEDGWLPVLHTSYVSAGGAEWRQELAARLPSRLGDALVALGRFEAAGRAPAGEKLRIALPPGAVTHPPCAGWRFRASAGALEDGAWVWTPGDGEVFYYAFALASVLPHGIAVGAEGYRDAKEAWCAYWRRRVEGDGVLFEVPERLVMDCQRNKLYQNLVLRWRYSVGCAVYDNNFYPSESGDAMTMLACYGYPAEARKGLAELIQWDRGGNYYLNWEKGEKLAHGAEYWRYTRDDAFIRERADIYRGYMRDFRAQMEDDPRGLLAPQRQCGDIPQTAYNTVHLTLGWRGMRDMARLLGRLGYEGDAAEFSAAAERLRDNLARAAAAAQRRLPDGSLFSPTWLFHPESGEVYDPVCATRNGSYWNLLAPYAFDSGFWPADGPEMDAILAFLRGHGSFLLGLLRFNYYPVEVGAHAPRGLPGYYTHGVDNVYLPSVLRMLAARDETEALLLTFYSYLAHGMTRGTFISGEGDSVGVYPGHARRSTYGSVSGAQNAVFLQALRTLLIQEVYDAEGEAAALRLTPATPGAWLDDGKAIRFRNAPTVFGPLSGQIISRLDDGRIAAEWSLPSRNPPQAVHWRLRLPGGRRLAAVTVNGRVHDRFDPETGLVDLTGLAGDISAEALCRQVEF